MYILFMHLPPVIAWSTLLVLTWLLPPHCPCHRVRLTSPPRQRRRWHDRC